MGEPKQERDLFRRWLMLSHVTRVKIAIRLGISRDGDINMPQCDFNSRFARDVKAQGKMIELWDIMQGYDPDEKNKNNPFVS